MSSPYEYPQDREPIDGSYALVARPNAGALSTWVMPQSSESDQSEDDINLREYWETIVKHKWTVLGFFALAVIGAFVASQLMPPIYRATTVLQIEREAAKIVDFGDASGDDRQNISGNDFYQTQYELLKSKSLAERVVDQVGIDNIDAGNTAKQQGLFDWLFGDDKAKQHVTNAQINADALKLEKLNKAEHLLKSLTVEPIRNSRLVKLSFDSQDPAFASKMANQFAQNFIGSSLERRFESTAYAKTFLENRIAQVKLKLEDAEKAQIEYAKQHGIVSVDKDGSTTSTINLGEFNLALAKVQQDRIKAESLYLQVKHNATGELPQVLENAVIQSLKNRKSTLEASYREKLSTFKPGFPAMLELEQQIEEVNTQLNAEINNVRNSIKANFEAAKSQEGLIQTRLQQSKAEIIEQQSSGVQYSILKREADTNRQLYDGLLQRLKEVSVAGGVGTNNVSVVDKAEVPQQKHKPRTLLNVLIASIIGLLGGIGLAFLFEHLDDTFKNATDIERKLRAPVLGIIPHIAEMSPSRGPLQIAIEEPRSSLAEAFRSLRTSLQFSREGGTPKVIAFTSAQMAEGKSTSALSLAIQLALAGKQVLLIDADLRKHSLHQLLDKPAHHGLTNFLADENDPVGITNSTEVQNLFFIPSGPLPPNPAELLMSNKMTYLLNIAREKFDHVIIDGPPTLGLADALVLANVVDAMIMVVAANETRKPVVENAYKRLQAVRGKLLGVVLTKVKKESDAYYNEYYYAYGNEVGGQRSILDI